MTLSNFNWTIDRLLASCDRSSEGHWTLAVQEHVKIHSCFRDTAGKSNFENRGKSPKNLCKERSFEEDEKTDQKKGEDLTWISCWIGWQDKGKYLCYSAKAFVSRCIDRLTQNNVGIVSKTRLICHLWQQLARKTLKAFDVDIATMKPTHSSLHHWLSFKFLLIFFSDFYLFSAEYFQPDTKASVARPPFLCNLLQGSL